MIFLEKYQMKKICGKESRPKYAWRKRRKTGHFLKKVRAPRKAPSICYYPMKTLFEYKGKGMLFFFEILEPK